MVVLEALAVGLPVVATRVEGTPEVIRDGCEGYLAEPSDPNSLALTLEKMVGDRHAWCRMSEQAWMRHREAFSDLHMAQTVAATYELTLGEASARRLSPSGRQVRKSQQRSAEPRWLLPYARRLGNFIVDA